MRDGWGGGERWGGGRGGEGTGGIIVSYMAEVRRNINIGGGGREGERVLKSRIHKESIG